MERLNKDDYGKILIPLITPFDEDQSVNSGGSTANT